MHPILEQGISFIAFLQSFRTPLWDSFFTAVSIGSSKYFYFIAIPLLFCLIDRRLALRVTLVVLSSVVVNSLLKVSIAQPRPYQLDPALMILPEPGYGFPSGHVQQTLVFWATLALYYRKTWLWALGGCMLILVGLARMYVGAHFPSDVLGAIVVGSVLVAASQKLIPYLHKHWQQAKWAWVLGSCALLFWGAYAISEKEMVPAGGLMSGLIIGTALLSSQQDLPRHWFWRFAYAGFAGFGLLVLFALPKLLLSGWLDAFAPFSKVMHYLVCGLWLSMSLSLWQQIQPKFRKCLPQSLQGLGESDF